MRGDSFVLESPSLDLEISRGDYFREDFWTLGQIGGIFHSKIEWFDSGGPPTKVHTTVNAAFQERGEAGRSLKVFAGWTQKQRTSRRTLSSARKEKRRGLLNSPPGTGSWIRNSSRLILFSSGGHNQSSEKLNANRKQISIPTFITENYFCVK